MVRNGVQVIAEAGQGEGTVTLRTRAQRQFTIGNTRYKLVIRIDVIDDGPGVPPEILDRIFFPLVTSRAGGVGLGLSIAHSLIHKNGGLIQCSSRPGETIFSTWLPTEAPPWNV
jgi:two-component system nitrogen regulation sensor histidine kinase GlnL